MSAVTLVDAIWAVSATLGCRSRGVDQVFESHPVADWGGVPEPVEDGKQLLLGYPLVLAARVIQDRGDQALHDHGEDREPPPSRFVECEAVAGEHAWRVIAQWEVPVEGRHPQCPQRES